MKLRNFSIFAASALCAGAAFHSAALAEAPDNAPQPLAMTGKWNIDYAAEGCSLTAAFGSGDTMITLRMTRFEPSRTFVLELSGTPVSIRPRPKVLSYAFGPRSGDPMTAYPASIGYTGSVPFLTVPPIDLAGRYASEVGLTLDQERALTYADLRYGEGPTYRLQTGAMVAPMQALRACTVDLVKSWGFDPEPQITRKKAPSYLNPLALMAASDYPSDLKQEHSVTVYLRLDVSETGAVTGCHLQRAVEPAALGEVTCKMMVKRAKFAPALDKDGKPFRSFYVTNFNWQVPQ